MDWQTAASLAASGWADTTRLARGDVTMGAGIVATNAPAIAARVRDLIAALDAWLLELERLVDRTAPRPPSACARRETPRVDGPMSEEQVLVVARDLVPDAAGWYGLRQAGLMEFLEVVEREGRYASRAEMELDPRFKQIIPYLVLRDGDRYFLMRRTRAGVDQRLHDRWSIGVGGHLNPGDDGLLVGRAGSGPRSWRPTSSRCSSRRPAQRR